MACAKEGCRSNTGSPIGGAHGTNRESLEASASLESKRCPPLPSCHYPCQINSLFQRFNNSSIRKSSPFFTKQSEIPPGDGLAHRPSCRTTRAPNRSSVTGQRGAGCGPANAGSAADMEHDPLDWPVCMRGLFLHDDFRIISDANLVIIQIVSCRRELGARGLTEAAGSAEVSKWWHRRHFGLFCMTIFGLFQTQIW